MSTLPLGEEAYDKGNSTDLRRGEATVVKMGSSLSFRALKYLYYEERRGGGKF